MRNRNSRHQGGCIRISPGEDGFITIHLPYSSERVEKIRTVAGRIWDKERKRWNVPHSRGIISRLQALFQGEPTAIDPSLLAPITPESNRQTDGLQDAVCLHEMEQALKLEGASVRTRKPIWGTPGDLSDSAEAIPRNWAKKTCDNMPFISWIRENRTARWDNASAP